MSKPRIFPGCTGPPSSVEEERREVRDRGRRSVSSLARTVIKGTARKVRRLSPGGFDVVAGLCRFLPQRCFHAAGTALKPSGGGRPGFNWRGPVSSLPRTGAPHKYLQKLEAMLIATDGRETAGITGAGDGVEPEPQPSRPLGGRELCHWPPRAALMDSGEPRRRKPSPATRLKESRLTSAFIQWQPSRDWRNLTMTDLTPRENAYRKLGSFYHRPDDAKRAVGRGPAQTAGAAAVGQMTRGRSIPQEQS